MKKIIFILTLIVIVQSTDARTFYRTKKSGDWNDRNIWEYTTDTTNGGVWSDVSITDPLPIEKVYSGVYHINKDSDIHVIIMENHDIISDKSITFDGQATNPTIINSLEIRGKLEVKGEIDKALAIKNGSLRMLKNTFLNVTGMLLVHGNLELSGSWLTGYSGGSTSKEAYIGVKYNVSTGTKKNKIDNDGKVRYGGSYTGGGVDGDVAHSDDPLLPIELKNFTVNIKNSIANFIWVTATEENNDYFTIEQSTNLQNWEVIHTEQGAGNSTTELQYTAQKKINKLGEYYFRLKQTDYDGKYTYSKIISAQNTMLSGELVPKVFIHNNELVITNNYNVLQIFDTQGRLVKTYRNTNVINNLNEKGILLFMFDNKYTQKIIKNF